MRKPIIAANWKMHKTTGEARTFLGDFAPRVAGATETEIVICPPFTSLVAVGEGIRGTNIALGAQNLYHEPQGAFTGEISAAMLRDLGCQYVIIGHSERRQYFGETDDSVTQKVKAAYTHGLTPILCVGETLQERDAGETRMVVRRQMEKPLVVLTADQATRLVIAYEPVWAIGSGRAATLEDANEVSAYIRRIIANIFGDQVAQAVRIQYGGSVKPANIGQFMAQPDIDGALVGGASLEAESFAGIVKFGG